MSSRAMVKGRKIVNRVRRLKLKKPVKWIKIEQGNDWGNIYYAPKGKCHSSWGTCSFERGLKLKKGEIPVRFPNGKVKKVKLTTIPYYEHISEQGSLHGYGVSSEEWGFYMDVNGTKTWFDLTQVEIREDQFEHGKYNGDESEDEEG